MSYMYTPEQSIHPGTRRIAISNDGSRDLLAPSSPLAAPVCTESASEHWYIFEVCAYIGQCAWCWTLYHFTGYILCVGIWPTSPRSLARFSIRRELHESGYMWISITLSIHPSLESWSIANVGGTGILRLHHDQRSPVSKRVSQSLVWWFTPSFPTSRIIIIAWPSGFLHTLTLHCAFSILSAINPTCIPRCTCCFALHNRAGLAGTLILSNFTRLRARGHARSLHQPL